jgi:hypothetical protein
MLLKFCLCHQCVSSIFVSSWLNYHTASSFSLHLSLARQSDIYKCTDYITSLHCLLSFMAPLKFRRKIQHRLQMESFLMCTFVSPHTSKTTYSALLHYSVPPGHCACSFFLLHFFLAAFFLGWLAAIFYGLTQVTLNSDAE